jgi:acetylcholinesterase
MQSFFSNTSCQFGGDPDQVVIHGASAGAGSVAHHLTAYGGRNDRLFVGAIPQSSFWPTQRTVSEMEFQFQRFVEHTGCSGAANPLDCLRGLNLSTIAAANVGSPFPGATGTSQWYFLPVVDGELVVDHMYELFSSGRFIHVPVLVQNDNNEGSLFAPNASTAAEVEAFLNDNYPHLTTLELNDIMKAYPKMAPLPEHAAWFPSASAAYGDATFICPGIEIAHAAARYGDKVWNSRFNVQDPANTAAGIGTWHTFDTFAIFGCGYAGTCDEAYLTINAGIIPMTMDYFLSFVRELDPNVWKSSSAPVWESFGSGQRLRLQTNDTAMENLPRDELRRCYLWMSLHGLLEY